MFTAIINILENFYIIIYSQQMLKNIIDGKELNVTLGSYQNIFSYVIQVYCDMFTLKVLRVINTIYFKNWNTPICFPKTNLEILENINDELLIINDLLLQDKNESIDNVNKSINLYYVSYLKKLVCIVKSYPIIFTKLLSGMLITVSGVTFLKSNPETIKMLIDYFNNVHLTNMLQSIVVLI